MQDGTLSMRQPSILPGFMIPFGSSACLIARIISSATGSFTCFSSSDLQLPDPVLGRHRAAELQHHLIDRIVGIFSAP